ncbi:coiled-coil-helix-coiled-coil-helix domain-containing protein 2-like [Neolamprologus brichardi]|uniref:coiled-coil-helix-coiled-coil-helix domain-containing protein 2-like n=1 Tax=Neolamprologus brichardi TaxID=32507 RepID=UPI001643BD38|nr:coiled-coil-helix-coiled-coil-helix domain-containing protein 2-like [Neolamprologus brichardi]
MPTTYAPPLCPAPSAVGTPSGQGMFAVYIPTSTATGVAVGLGVGTTINQTMTGGFGGGHPEPSRPDVTHQEPYHHQQQQQQRQACSYELGQFVACALNQSDLKLCEGFNEALKKCMSANGLSLEDKR